VHSAQSLRFASSAPSPSVDEIQFQVIGDPATAEYPTRPFPSKTKQQLEEGVKQKANQVRNQWEAKFTAEPEGPILKDLLELKPYDEKALKEELQFVTHPHIQPTTDVAYNTKNHNFLTEFLASRTASYLEDPTLYFSYGENPSAALTPTWNTTLGGNLNVALKRELFDSLAAFAAEAKEADQFEKNTAKLHQELLKKMQDDIEFLSDKTRFAKSLEDSGMSPQHIAQMTEIVTTDPLALKQLPLSQKQEAELAQYRQQSATVQQFNELVASGRELVKQLQASGLQFDASKVSF
jgi:hypothetical protein